MIGLEFPAEALPVCGADNMGVDIHLALRLTLFFGMLHLIWLRARRAAAPPGRAAAVLAAAAILALGTSSPRWLGIVVVSPLLGSEGRVLVTLAPAAAEVAPLSGPPSFLLIGWFSRCHGTSFPFAKAFGYSPPATVLCAISSPLASRRTTVEPLCQTVSA